MAEVPLFICDASAALRWVFPDRDYTNQAQDMMADFNGGRINLIAPYHFRMEVGSGIRRAVVDRKIRHQRGVEVFSRFLSNRIPVVDEVGLTETAFDNCQGFSISIRDALYVTLAQFYEVPLITADENCFERLSGSPTSLPWPTTNHNRDNANGRAFRPAH
jgi:predicted nucleic acid-binding protein